MLYETDSVKYLGIQIDKILISKQQIHHVVLNKLNKAHAMLSKLRRVGCKNYEVSLLCNI